MPRREETKITPSAFGGKKNYITLPEWKSKVSFPMGLLSRYHFAEGDRV